MALLDLGRAFQVFNRLVIPAQFFFEDAQPAQDGKDMLLVSCPLKS